MPIFQFISRIFWKTTVENIHVYYKNQEKPFQYLEARFSDSRINFSFNQDNQHWIHEEWIKIISGQIYVTPEKSICVSGLRSIYFDSLHWPQIRPSVSKYLTSRVFFKRQFVKEIILLDGHGSTNYFHFLIDVVSKLWLLDQIPNSNKLPILINEKVFHLPYFQDFFSKNEMLKNRALIIQSSNKPIVSNKVWLIKALPFAQKNLTKMRSLEMASLKRDVSKKLFVNRKSTSNRHIFNSSELYYRISKMGFEEVFLEDLPFLDQINLFHNASHIIAVHGAGLANMLFCKEDTCILELIPSNRIACQYYWLANALDFQNYSCVLGSDLVLNQQSKLLAFTVDPQIIEEIAQSWQSG